MKQKIPLSNSKVKNGRRNSFLRVLLIVGLMLPIGVFAGSSEKTWNFLIPGVYSRGEAPLNPGDGWLALARVGNNWHLVETVVKAVPVEDPLGDAKGEKTAVDIKTSESGAIALIRKQMKPGRIDDVGINPRGNTWSYLSGSGSSSEVVFKGEILTVETTDNKVYLRNGNRRSELAGLLVGGDNSVAIHWAGDLDRDGMLDLLISYSGYNVTGTCLFVSRGTNKELVREASCHWGTG